MQNKLIAKETSFKKEGNKNLKQQTIGGFFWLFGGSGSQAILQIIILSILARLVTPYDFGVIGIALIVIGFSRIFSQMGMGPAIVQRVELTEAHIRTGFTSSLVLGVVFCLLLIFSSSHLAVFFEMPELNRILQIIALMFVIDSFIVVSQSLLQKKLRLKLYALTNLLSYAIGYGLVGIFLALLDYGVWALVYGQLAQSVICAILVSLIEPHSVIPYWSKKAFNELFYFSGGFTIAKIANYFAGQGDNLVVGKLLGADALGLYSRAYQIMVAPVNLIGNSLDKALFPAMVSVQYEKKKLQNAFLKSVELIAIVSLPVSAIIIINAPEIVMILLGENWTEITAPLQILGIGILFRMSYKISDSLARAVGVVYKRAWRQAIYAGAIFSGAMIGHYWDLSGVAIGITLAIIINFLLMAHLSLNELEIKWIDFFKKHLKAIFLTVAVALTGTLIIEQLRLHIANVFVREIIFLSIISVCTCLLGYLFRRMLGIEKEIDKINGYIKHKLKLKYLAKTNSSSDFV